MLVGGRQLDRATAALLVSFILAGPLLISPWGFDHALMVKEAFLLIVSGFLFVLYLVRVVIGHESSPELTPLRKPILVLLVAAIMSLFQAINLPSGFYRLGLFLAGLSLYHVVMHANLDSGCVRAFGKAAVASGLIATGYGFSQYFELDPLLPRYGVGPTSTLGNPNFLADYLIFAIPLSLGLSFSSEEARWRQVYLLSSLILFSGLLLTKTKAASLGLVFSIAVFALLVRRQSVANPRKEFRRLLPFAALVIVISGIFGFAYFSQFAGPGGVRGVLERYASRQGIYFKWRVIFYHDTLRMILANPLFGVGIGNFEYAYPRYRSMPETLDPEANILEHVFNDYLEYWAELGPVGLFAFLWLLWVFFKKMLHSRGLCPLACGYAASATGIAINSLFAFVLYTPMPFAALWLSMALALRLHEGALPARGQPVGTDPNHRIPLWAIFLALLATGALLYLSVRPLVADAYLSRGDKLFKRGRLNQSIPPLEQAARLAPARLEAQGTLARTYFFAGRYTEAVAVLDRYLHFDPYNFRTQYLKGLYIEQAGDEDAALKAYEKAREDYPLYSKPLLRIGVIRERRGDMQGAMAAYREAIRLNPAFAEAANNLAILLSAQGNLDEAIQVWEDAGRESPNDPILAQNLAAGYLKKGDTEKAALWNARSEKLRDLKRQ